MAHDPHQEAPPIARFYDLNDLSEAGDEVQIVARPEDLPPLARWFGVSSVERFEAKVTLTRKSGGTFEYEADLTADLTQACVVSLEPVPSHHDLHVSRVLHVSPQTRRRRAAPEPEEGGVLTIAAADDDVPEELESPRYDLAIPLLEELSLDLDPYPRADGVELEVPEEHRQAKESPFAVLKGLKKGGS